MSKDVANNEQHINNLSYVFLKIPVRKMFTEFPKINLKEKIIVLMLQVYNMQLN